HARSAGSEIVPGERRARERDERGGVRAGHGLRTELEFLAKLDVFLRERRPAGRGRVPERAAPDAAESALVEVGAIVAREAEREALRLVAQAGVDERPHGRLRARSATTSTWLV